MSKKNFQKRSQAFGAKSRCQKTAKSRSPDSKKANDNATLSGASDEEKNVGEKENVTINGTADTENLLIVLKVRFFSIRLLCQIMDSMLIGCYSN